MISFYTLSTASDLLVGVESTASSQPSLFSSFNRQQPFKLVNLPQTKSMFSHVGWTAGMEWSLTAGILDLPEVSGRAALTAGSTARATPRCLQIVCGRFTATFEFSVIRVRWNLDRDLPTVTVRA